MTRIEYERELLKLYKEEQKIGKKREKLTKRYNKDFLKRFKRK